MSELPISEGFLLSAGAMIFGCFAGLLTCILRSRCQKIKFGCIECERDVIPSTDLASVNVDFNQTTT